MGLFGTYLFVCADGITKVRLSMGMLDSSKKAGLEANAENLVNVHILSPECRIK